MFNFLSTVSAKGFDYDGLYVHFFLDLPQSKLNLTPPSPASKLTMPLGSKSKVKCLVRAVGHVLCSLTSTCIISCLILSIDSCVMEPQSKVSTKDSIFWLFYGMFILNNIVDWRPVDDPVLSGVTQTCVTKLEGEVMNGTHRGGGGGGRVGEGDLSSFCHFFSFTQNKGGRSGPLP